MCSTRGFILMIISCLIFNCLHFIVGAEDGSNKIGLKSQLSNHQNHVSNQQKLTDDSRPSHQPTNNNNNNQQHQYQRIGPLHIDITRKHSIRLNGVEINENSLVHHLAEHEKELIFGSTTKLPRAVKLVHLRHLPVGKVDTVRKPSQLPLPHNRQRRSIVNGATVAAASDTIKPQTIENATERQTDVPQKQQQHKKHQQADNEPPIHEVSVQIQDNDQLVHLRLHPTPKLIDDAFIFIRRYANTSQFIEDSHKLAARYERCFYSSENAALDLCDEQSVRGVFQHNSTDFIIQPLPTRFGNTTHVILETDHLRPTDKWVNTKRADFLDRNVQFEPDMQDFEEEENVLQLGTMENFEYTARATRKFDDEQAELSNRKRHHHHNQDLNLSFKPRYLYHKHHHQLSQNGQRPSHHQNQHFQQQHSTSSSSTTTTHHFQHQRNHRQHRRRRRRHISASGSQWRIPHVLHIETAIFVDNDLVRHMSKNFPEDTERQLMRFVLAMINGVQLLYHHPTLGHRVNFVLKRLEILYTDPPDLRRSSDIDIYLSNFCMWQKKNNPSSDAEPLHYDHAVILTGLDLYVVGKNGKVISQVVGLAPVAGMCTPTSSCTINEGKHFESVFVVAHEIGHNLGMRHDTNENGCDPSFHIMSPTLGSGKITWSKCSRTYLNSFLETTQAQCLFDRGQFIKNLDHNAEGLMPGERFDADQQCMLKYGRDSVRARNQLKSDICRDLHCQRERYTWTSHPALEGTECGENMWCRSGACSVRPNSKDMPNDIPKEALQGSTKPTYDKSSFLEQNKIGHPLYEYNHNKSPTWSEWSNASECDSGCLYGPSNRLREGSTGLKVYSRSCLDYRRRCLGRDKKYQSCVAKQCYSIKITTITDFATGVCEKAQKFDAELTGRGEQIVGDIEESCKVYCRTKTNSTKSRSWTFPDGTTCRSKHYPYEATAYCIGGRCEKFSCDNSSSNYYKINSIFCRDLKREQEERASDEVESRRSSSNNSLPGSSRSNSHEMESRRDEGGFRTRIQNRNFAQTTVRSKYENEVALRNFHGQPHNHSFKRKSDGYPGWNKYSYHFNEQYAAATPSSPSPPVSASLIAAPPPPSPPEPEWIVKSGCHSSCMAKSKGVQVVTSRLNGANNIQLCTHAAKHPCDHLLTPTEYAENTCMRYKLKVRGLSGYGTQIAASVDDPDRSCRVGCQDEFIKYRFYLVNGKYGHFPLGTKCSNTEERYCVNGKCLEFGTDNIPLQQSHVNLAVYRNRRSVIEGRESNKNLNKSHRRSKRSYLYYAPVNITETITQDFINNIVNSIIDLERKPISDDFHNDDHIEFTNPIHMSMNEELSIE